MLQLACAGSIEIQRSVLGAAQNGGGALVIDLARQHTLDSVGLFVGRNDAELILGSHKRRASQRQCVSGNVVDGRETTVVHLLHTADLIQLCHLDDLGVVEISDTFTQFAAPLMKKLGWPTIFCNTLEVAKDGEITGFRMRCEKSKLSTVKALQSVGFETIAAGDSYNDLGMIQASKAGFLFRSTDKIKKDYPELPAYESYDELLTAIKFAL